MEMLLEKIKSKPLDHGNESFSVPSCSSSPPRTLHLHPSVSRRLKVSSESASHDHFHRNLLFPSPDNSSKRFLMDEEGTLSQDEDINLLHSTRSKGYLFLTQKDRLRSASLEWNLSNGSITPRLSHYNTHPPLDFKSLKEKLEQLTGSPDDAKKKSSSSGHDRRRGIMSALAMVPLVTSPSTDGCSPVSAGGVRSVVEPEIELKTSTTSSFLNSPSGTIGRRTRLPTENDTDLNIRQLRGSDSSSRDADALTSVHWRDLAHHLAEQDVSLQQILQRHNEELEDLKKKHSLQWAELRRIILPMKGNHLYDEPLSSAPPNHPFQSVSPQVPGMQTCLDSPYGIQKEGSAKCLDQTELRFIANAEYGDAVLSTAADTPGKRSYQSPVYDGITINGSVIANTEISNSNQLKPLEGAAGNKSVKNMIYSYNDSCMLDEAMNGKQTAILDWQMTTPLLSDQRLMMLEIQLLLQLLKVHQNQLAFSVGHRMRQPDFHYTPGLEPIMESQIVSPFQPLCPYAGPMANHLQSLPLFSRPTVYQNQINLTDSSAFSAFADNDASLHYQVPCREISSCYLPGKLPRTSDRPSSSPEQMKSLLEVAQRSTLALSPLLVKMLPSLIARHSPIPTDFSCSPHCVHPSPTIPFHYPMPCHPYPAASPFDFAETHLPSTASFLGHKSYYTWS